MRISTGRLGGRTVECPPKARLRPTTDMVRAAVFNRLADRLVGCRFLDLYAGTGAVGLEALSRGATEVVWIEGNTRNYRILRSNVEQLAPETLGGVIQGRVETRILTLSLFDLVWADPPYDHDPRRVMEMIEESPVHEPGTIVILEHASRTPPPDTLGRLVLLDRRAYGDTTISRFSHG